jgi:hypothetical protein
METLLGILHVLWLPTAIALGFLISKKHRPNTNKFIGLGCLWSFLLYVGGFIALIAIGLATCKIHFQ